MDRPRCGNVPVECYEKGWGKFYGGDDTYLGISDNFMKSIPTYVMWSIMIYPTHYPDPSSPLSSDLPIFRHRNNWEIGFQASTNLFYFTCNGISSTLVSNNPPRISCPYVLTVIKDVNNIYLYINDILQDQATYSAGSNTNDIIELGHSLSGPAVDYIIAYALVFYSNNNFIPNVLGSHLKEIWTIQKILPAIDDSIIYYQNQPGDISYDSGTMGLDLTHTNAPPCFQSTLKYYSSPINAAVHDYTNERQLSLYNIKGVK